MTTDNKNNNFKSGFIHCSDFCPEKNCKIAHFNINNASLAYSNTQLKRKKILS